MSTSNSHKKPKATNDRITIALAHSIQKNFYKSLLCTSLHVGFLADNIISDVGGSSDGICARFNRTTDGIHVDTMLCFIRANRRPALSWGHVHQYLGKLVASSDVVLSNVAAWYSYNADPKNIFFRKALTNYNNQFSTATTTTTTTTTTTASSSLHVPVHIWREESPNHYSDGMYVPGAANMSNSHRPVDFLANNFQSDGSTPRCYKANVAKKKKEKMEAKKHRRQLVADFVLGRMSIPIEIFGNSTTNKCTQWWPPVLGIRQLSEIRWDAHMDYNLNTKKLDCQHWCFPGVTDAWVQIFGLYLKRYSRNFPKVTTEMMSTKMRDQVWSGWRSMLNEKGLLNIVWNSDLPAT